MLIKSETHSRAQSEEAALLAHLEELNAQRRAMDAVTADIDRIIERSRNPRLARYQAESASERCLRVARACGRA